MLQLLLCADDTLANPLQVLLYNISRSTPDDIKDNLVVTLGYLKDELSESNLHRIQETASILKLNLAPKECPSMFSEWLLDSAWRNKPLTSLIPLWFLSNSDKSFVYLDIDVLLLEGWYSVFHFIYKMYHLQMPLAMVRDPNIPEFPRELLNDEFLSTFVSSSREPYDYFNSGVMVFNANSKDSTDISKIESIWKRCKSLGRTFMNQDVINIIFEGKILSMDDEFNLFCSDPHMWTTSRRLSSLKPPKILHFAGPKPFFYSDEKKRIFLDTMNQVPLSQPFRLAQIKYLMLEFEFRTFKALNP